jgi:hypothetical protein
LVVFTVKVVAAATGWTGAAAKRASAIATTGATMGHAGWLGMRLLLAAGRFIGRYSRWLRSVTCTFRDRAEPIAYSDVAAAEKPA